MKRLVLVMGCLCALVCAMAVGAWAEDKEVQGRCVAADKEKMTVTILKDAKKDMQSPDYQVPALVFALTPDMALPKAGKRIKLDAKKNQILIFDDAAGAIKTIDYTLAEQKEGVEPDNALVAGKKFPIVDKAAKTVSVYSKRQKILTVFALPEAYAASADSLWDNGDELKISYSEDGKAAKLENLSKK